LPGALQVGEWRVEPELDLIVRDGRVVKIEPRAMRVLLCLVARAGHVVSVRELLEQVWPDVVVGPDSVYQATALLRRMLGDDRHHPTYITHVPRKGYRLIAPVGPATPTEVPAASASASPADSTQARAAESDPAVASATAASASVAGPRRRGWMSLALAATALAAVVLLPRGSPQHAPLSAAQATAAPQIVPARRITTAPSIAVLPFLDMTEKQDLGYFADGLSEELIDLLSRESELRVPARTSSFYFKGKPTTIAEVAKALGVENVLEGSVRRSGERVRVTAQLIRADSGYHLWSQTYDREFTETFTVEDDIARAVSTTLQVKLNAGQPANSGLAANGEARALSLQCQFFIQRNTGADADKAVNCYRELLTLVPQHAAAWAGYADALWRQPFLTEGTQMKPSLAAARQAAEHALLLDPAIASPHATIAAYHRVVERDWGAAQAELNAALTADPQDPASLLAAAILARNLGQFARAIDLCERARVRDPLNFLPYARLGTIYLYLGKLPEAEAAVRRRLDLSPEGQGGYAQLADVLLARGLPRAALEAVQQETDESNRLQALALVYHALGRRADADAVLNDLVRKYGSASLELADVYAYRGEIDRAFATLDKAFISGEPGLSAIKSDSYLKPLHADPRYVALLRKLKLPERDPV
jgi:TolB-like protein/DNA-binding winged helix-turn-helix (wHTH) protein/Flp pilus assembly protein TadD